MTDGAALEYSGVQKRYGETVALRGVELSIRRGEFFALLGPNGAGKSTLINITAGLVRVDAGRVAVLGHDTVTRWRMARPLLGVVPQEIVFEPFFSVVDTLRIQAGYYGCRRSASWPWIDELLERLDLTGKRDSAIHKLSGGMKRRVLIAQALVHRPPVVILDEPTAGVDVELRRSLWELMRELNGQGTTIVLTTHYLEEARTLCERLAILDHGSVRALDSIDALIARHRFGFLDVTTLGGRTLPERLRPLVVRQKDDALELMFDRTQHTIDGLRDALRAAGFADAAVEAREPTLEDVFIELTDKDAA